MKSFSWHSCYSSNINLLHYNEIAPSDNNHNTEFTEFLNATKVQKEKAKDVER